MARICRDCSTLSGFSQGTGVVWGEKVAGERCEIRIHGDERDSSERDSL